MNCLAGRRPGAAKRASVGTGRAGCAARRGVQPYEVTDFKAVFGKGIEGRYAQELYFCRGMKPCWRSAVWRCLPL